jgi:hypothetical protein
LDGEERPAGGAVDAAIERSACTLQREIGAIAASKKINLNDNVWA